MKRLPILESTERILKGAAFCLYSIEAIGYCGNSDLNLPTEENVVGMIFAVILAAMWFVVYLLKESYISKLQKIAKLKWIREQEIQRRRDEFEMITLDPIDWEMSRHSLSSRRSPAPAIVTSLRKAS